MFKCRRLNWDTVSEPGNEHFETRNSTKFARKLPNFGHFSDSINRSLKPSIVIHNYICTG